MKKQQSGFTLIELIAVIVILGILAAVAVPKFVDLSDEAEAAAAAAMASGINSASSLNYAVYVADEAGLTTGKTIHSVTQCDKTELEALMQGTIGSQYSIAGASATEAGETLACTLTPTGGEIVNFSVISTAAAAATP